MEELARRICQANGLDCRYIQELSGGQVNRVFLIDHEYVLRIGQREDALARLKRETDVLQYLAGKIPVPKIHACGQQDGWVYQVQQFIPGQKLYAVWRQLSPSMQENIAAELAAHLKILHSTAYPFFGLAPPDSQPYTAWADFIAGKFNQTLVEIETLKLRMAPGFMELAAGYISEYKSALEGGTPVLVHGDLSMTNILVDNGSISALLDFEYALQAPADYELWVPESFCLYPNDYAEEENEAFCSADFASFIPLLRKHYPELFEAPHLRERVNIYHLAAALDNYLSWRKDNLNTIPPERMAAKEFYMARITNFIRKNGIRLFQA